MDCPICGETITPIDVSKNAWKKKYKCPNCNKTFTKKTFLNKATRFAGNLILYGLIGDAVGSDSGGGGDYS